VRSEDIDVVLEVGCNIKLGLKDKCHVILKHCQGVSPPLEKDSETISPKGSLEGSDIARFFGESSVAESEE
jgi:hypothetical protein